MNGRARLTAIGMWCRSCSILRTGLVVIVLGDAHMYKFYDELVRCAFKVEFVYMTVNLENGFILFYLILANHNLSV